MAKGSPCGQFYDVTDAEGQYGRVNLLRPLKVMAAGCTEQYLQREEGNMNSGEMPLVRRERNCEMWNEASRQHEQHEDRCHNPHFSICK